MKIKKRHKKQITQIGRWSIFIMSAVTLTMKVVEAAAYESLQLMINNPELVEVYNSMNK